MCVWGGGQEETGDGGEDWFAAHRATARVAEWIRWRLIQAVSTLAAETLDFGLAPADVPVDGEIGSQRLEGGTYAVARVRIQPRQYMETWDQLMSEWLPGSGFQPDDRPCLEIHLNDHLVDHEGWHEVELCLAVKPL